MLQEKMLLLQPLALHIRSSQSRFRYLFDVLLLITASERYKAPPLAFIIGTSVETDVEVMTDLQITFQLYAAFRLQ